MSIKLGSMVRDVYTGFEGIAIGKTEWLYGCTRIAIEAVKLHENKPVGLEWFDEQRVELVKPAAPEIATESTARTGGPQRDPVGVNETAKIGFGTTRARGMVPSPQIPKSPNP